MTSRTTPRSSVLLVSLSLAVLGFALGAAPAAAHACQESTAGDTGVRCGSCVEGQYHDHGFRDGTHCSTPEPCNGIACITEGICKAFPKVCNPNGLISIKDLPLP